MKKILAVSGGIDSVVMLHLLKDDPDVIVAHFDHGIRPSSADDAVFVSQLAKKYHKLFFVGSAHLGANASEEMARRARYDFLFGLAERFDGRVYTAHHSDDLVESAVINMLRGTGWRGLAALNDRRIVRPLLDWSKSDIYEYATKNDLHFRLDQTNSDDKYLRNRVRESLRGASAEQKKKLSELAFRQRTIANEIDDLISNLSRKNIYSKNIMSIDDDAAQEILRFLLVRVGISQTRPQLGRAVEAIRSYAPNKKFPLNKDYYIKVGRYNFHIEPARIATEA
ncbi:MAG: tRNA lysidine(34) synthetase TilS [Candidatus Saccharibacteria bacterium]|nr:tRNA lysidine(34) synthetase TilS [Candidatus Saccharibacteria bacterium]